MQSLFMTAASKPAVSARPEASRRAKRLMGARVCSITLSLSVTVGSDGPCPTPSGN
jgi:hypothetical protein